MRREYILFFPTSRDQYQNLLLVEAVQSHWKNSLRSRSRSLKKILIRICICTHTLSLSGMVEKLKREASVAISGILDIAAEQITKLTYSVRASMWKFNQPSDDTSDGQFPSWFVYFFAIMRAGGVSEDLPRLTVQSPYMACNS